MVTRCRGGGYYGNDGIHGQSLSGYVDNSRYLSVL